MVHKDWKTQYGSKTLSPKVLCRFNVFLLTLTGFTDDAQADSQMYMWKMGQHSWDSLEGKAQNRRHMPAGSVVLC